MSSNQQQIELTHVHAITFDVGGTLLYPWPSVGEIYAEVMGRHGLNHLPEDLEAAFAEIWKVAHDIPRGSGAESEREWWREIVYRVVENIGMPDDFEALFDELWVTFCDPKRWQLFSGVRELLVELADRGYRLAVLSNWDNRLRPLLEALDLVKYFEEIIISHEVGVEKPHVEIFNIMVAKMACRPEELVHIGDSEHHDLVGAQRAGWQCLLVAPDTDGNKPGKLHDLALLLDYFPPIVV